MSATLPEVVRVYQNQAMDLVNDGSSEAAFQLVDVINAVTRVTSDEEAQGLVDAAKVCKVAAERLDDSLKTITKPLDAAKKAARDMAFPHIEKLMSASSAAKDKVMAWQREKQAAADAARREAERQQREAEAASVAIPDAPPPVSVYVPPVNTQVKGTVGGMHERKVLKVEIIDIELLAKNFPTFLELKPGAALLLARDQIKAMGDDCTVKMFADAGMRLYYDTTLALT